MILEFPTTYIMKHRLDAQRRRERRAFWNHRTAREESAREEHDDNVQRLIVQELSKFERDKK